MTIWNVCNTPCPAINNALIVFVDEKRLTMEKATEACAVIENTAKGGKRLALCYKKNAELTSQSQELKLLFMTMINNNDFSILEVDDVTDIDEDYAEAIFDAEIDFSELRATIGDDYAKFAEQVHKDSNNSLVKLVKSLIDITTGAITTTPANNNSEELKALNNSLIQKDKLIADMQVRISELTAKNDKNAKCIDEQALALRRQAIEIETLQDTVKDSADKLAVYQSNTQINAKICYVELDVDKLKAKYMANNSRLDVQNIIYFKELTPSKYINSFIINLIQYLKSTKQVNVQCLIYDDADFNRFKYGRLKILTGQMFKPGETLKNSSTVVVKDAAPQILEEALVTNNIVIIYDRMGEDLDIVKGRNVHKFMVVNSQKEMLELQRAFQIPAEDFITSFGTSKETLSVREIREYKQMSNGGKILTYSNMASTVNEEDSMYKRLLLRCNIK